ncbi:MAG: hypothetical protein ACLR1T_07590 [Evtepia gabavorous]
MLYFWILTVILFALPVGLVMLTWDRSQADARECVIRWQIIASALYFLATGPTSQGGKPPFDDAPGRSDRRHRPAGAALHRRAWSGILPLLSSPAPYTHLPPRSAPKQAGAVVFRASRLRYCLRVNVRLV